MALFNLKDFKKHLLADPTEIPRALSSSYYPFLDGLRALSIISVLAGHTFRESRLLRYMDGGVGVDIFFIISGFLITTLLLKEKTKFGQVSYKNFYIRRALRILPVAYLFVLILIVLNRLFSMNITTSQFLTTGFYIKNFQWPTDWYSAHFWSLSVEEQFYLLMPVVLLSNVNRYMLIVCALIVITPILNFLGFHNVGVFYSYHTIRLITFGLLAFLGRGAVYLFAGSLLSILIFKGIIKPEQFCGSRFLSLVLFLVGLIIHFLNIPFVSPVCFSLLILLVIAISLGPDNLLTQILSIKILVRIGILSYSIYIWQQLFTVYQPWAKAFPYADSAFFNLTALLLVSWLSYTFYESYFLKLKARFVKVPDAETTGRGF